MILTNLINYWLIINNTPKYFAKLKSAINLLQFCFSSSPLKQSFIALQSWVILMHVCVLSHLNSSSVHVAIKENESFTCFPTFSFLLEFKIVRAQLQ